MPFSFQKAAFKPASSRMMHASRALPSGDQHASVVTPLVNTATANVTSVGGQNISYEHSSGSNDDIEETNMKYVSFGRLLFVFYFCEKEIFIDYFLLMNFRCI